MPKFTGTIDIFDFDEEKYNASVFFYLEELLKLAAEEFSKATLARIPIRTGFVAGAFGTLEDLLGFKARLNPIVSTLREFYYPPGGQKILKTPTAGRQFATPGKEIFKKEGTRFTFTYDVDITYYGVNETTPGFSPTAPWQSLKAGEAAFIKYVNDNFKIAFPNPADFVKIETKRIETSSHRR